MSSKTGATLATLLGVLCGVMVTVTDAALLGWVITTTALLALGFFLVIHRSLSITSPPIVVALTYVIVAFSAPLILPRVSDAGGVSAILRLSSIHSQRTTLLFLLAALSVLLGATAHELSTTLQPGRVVHTKISAALRFPSIVLGSAALPVVFLVAGIGPGFIIQKDLYLGIAGSRQLVSLGTAFSLPAVALASCILFSGTNRRVRHQARLLLVAYGIVFFSLASRQLALLPLLILIGWLLSDRTAVPAWPRITAAMVATVILFSVPLTLRQLPNHGLRPYTTYVVANPDLLISPKLGALSNNLLFSYSLAGHVAYTELPIRPRIFWLMVNPLPGRYAGWEKVLPTQGVNAYTPFNALGQLGNFGWMYLVAYLSAIGWYLAHIRNVVGRRFPAGWQPVANTVCTGIAGLFAVTSLQYSLRTASRLIYYVIALEVFLRLVILPLRSGRRAAQQSVVMQ